MKNNHWGLVWSDSRPQPYVNVPRNYFVVLCLGFFYSLSLVVLFKRMNILFRACKYYTNRLNWIAGWMSLCDVMKRDDGFVTKHWSMCWSIYEMRREIFALFRKFDLSICSSAEYRQYINPHLWARRTRRFYAMPMIQCNIEPHSQETRSKRIRNIENVQVSCFPLQHSLEIWN